MKRVVTVEGPQGVACNLQSEFTKDKKLFKICFVKILVDNFASPFWVLCHIKADSAFHPTGSVNEYQLQLGRQRKVWFIPLADEHRVCR